MRIIVICAKTNYYDIRGRIFAKLPHFRLFAPVFKPAEGRVGCAIPLAQLPARISPAWHANEADAGVCGYAELDGAEAPSVGREAFVGGVFTGG